MKWLEEEQDEDGYPDRYRRAADAAIVRYQSATWRKAAVASTRKLIDYRCKGVNRTGELPRPPDNEQLRDWLDKHALSDIADMLLQDDINNNMSLGGALLAEAAGALFCNSPTVLRWQIAGQIIENDPVARRVLVNLIEFRMSKRPGLREDIRKVGRDIVRRVEQYPGRSAHRDDRPTFSEIRRQWKAKPDLREIWFGLRALGSTMPFRKDWYIFDLLFETDTAFAAELIEAFGEPYQPALILQHGAVGPMRRFADWERLMEVALPAFEPDGTWNGRTLLPLLLLSAQDAMGSGIGYRNEGDDVLERHDARLAELAEAIVSTLWTRSDGGTASLRWGGWLFRSAMSALDGEQVPFPCDVDSRARPAWLTIQAMLRPPAATAWLNLRPADTAPEDELCLEAVRILAAREHNRVAPGRELILQTLPDEPEEFLEGMEGKRMRELPSLFVIWGRRPDALGTRVLAASLLDADVATTFADIWRHTLTLREIAEHSHAYQTVDISHDDYARRASETIRFIISLGINLIDYVQDSRQQASFSDRRAVTLALFSTLYDATREMLAIDPIGRRDLASVHNHLVVRRFLYEGENSGDKTVAAPLTEAIRPTAGDLLYERCEVSQSFFDSLQTLLINGIERDRIERALAGVGVRLDHLVEQAERYNLIENTRTIDIRGLKTISTGEAS